MRLSKGTKLGPFEIEEAAGAGGMGEVYRARDIRLQRDVAVKVLPSELASNPERRQRLEREARAISSLSHPHICTLYDIGHQDGVDYLVMEYLDGEMLDRRLERGPLPASQVLKIGVEIADALDKAHRRGIIHRDLKPANVMITKGGAKLLDFGLAKPAVPVLNLMLTQTIAIQPVEPAAKPLTTEGALVGTFHYMAPEQVEGKEADARSDIFAVGAVLYEMATGRRAFDGRSQASVMAAILDRDPEPLSRVQPMSPLGLERAVQRCLAKDPEERWQSAGDLASELRWIATAGSGASAVVVAPAHPRRPAMRWLPWAVASVAVLTALLLALLAGRASPRTRQQFAIPVPGEVSHLALSPDGRYLAFVSPDDNSGAEMIFVQKIGAAGSTLLAGTEGASYPFWSPDDTYLGFFAEGKLKKVPLAGGPPQTLATVTAGRGGSWSPKNLILYTPDAGGPLWRINADGSNNVPNGDKLEQGESSHRWAVFLPDGDHYLYWRGDFDLRPETKGAIYLASVKDNSLHLLTHAKSSVAYGNGMVFFLDDRGSLVYAPLDVSTAKLTAEPKVIAPAVGFSPSTYWAAFTAADDGTVVYNSTLGGALSVLTWYDRSGKELGRLGDVAIQANPAISPDTTRVAVDVNDTKARNIDIWIMNVNTGTNTRFTFDPAEETNPVWSPDSSKIAFRRAGYNPSLVVKSASGLERERVLIKHDSGQDDLLPTTWSADGSQMVYENQSVAGQSQVKLASVRDGVDVPFALSSASTADGQVSPDGKWIAYASNESGDWEIYVTTFPENAGKWQVSRGGGTEPRWGGDGHTIYYIGPKGMLTAVPASEEGGFSTGVPQPLFRIHSRAPISSSDVFTYDVSRDGKRFLVNRYVKPESIPPLSIVLNATNNSQ